MQNMLKVNNRDTKTIRIVNFKHIPYLSSDSFVDIEKVNVFWKIIYRKKRKPELLGNRCKSC